MWADYKSARAGFGLLCITNANTQCGQITNPPEQAIGFIHQNACHSELESPSLKESHVLLDTLIISFIQRI